MYMQRALAATHDSESWPSDSSMETSSSMETWQRRRLRRRGCSSLCPTATRRVARMPPATPAAAVARSAAWRRQAAWRRSAAWRHGGREHGRCERGSAVGRARAGQAGAQKRSPGQCYRPRLEAAASAGSEVSMRGCPRGPSFFGNEDPCRGFASLRKPLLGRGRNRCKDDGIREGLRW